MKFFQFFLIPCIFLFYSPFLTSKPTITLDKTTNKNQLPSILNINDIKNYRQVIKYQRQAIWVKADQYLNKIENKLLKGYFEYDKLMHPNQYKASYQELFNWLENYKDFPVVMRKRVYKLMKKRIPNNKNIESEKPAYGNYLRGYGEIVNSVHAENISNEKRVIIKKNIDIFFNEKNYNKLIKYAKKDPTLKSYKIKLINNKIKKVYLSGNILESSRIYKYFYKKINIKDRDFLYTAGINAFRVGDHDLAKNYFNQCNHVEDLNNARYEKWFISACLYWLVKVDKNNKNKDQLLKKASLHPRTLYGQLSLEKLGIDAPFKWKKEYSFTNKQLDKISKYDSYARLLALAELNLYDKGDLELRNLYSLVGKKNEEILFYLSEILSLAAVQMRLGEKFRNKDDTIFIRGLYPIPNWKSNKVKYTIDEALIFALIRRESAFNIKAKSHKGARGLMQLMPRTASKINKDYRLRYGHVHKLYSLKLNLDVGQRYLTELLVQERTNKSILDVLIAYNAGLKRLKKWKINNQKNDPLVFIESIPITETRWFVKNILTDLWIYRDRLGQKKPTRKSLAKGTWPKYRKLDYIYSIDAKLRLK